MRKLGRLGALGAVIVGTALAVVAFPLGSSAAPAPTTQAEDYAMTIRAEFGFPSDLEYVRAVAQQRDATDTDLGTPLTAGEHADMETRRHLGERIAAINALVPGGATVYAGAWMDQAAGGVLNVAFTRDPDQSTRNAVEALLPAAAKLVFDGQSGSSLSHLTELQRRFAKSYPYWRGRGVDIQGTEVDVIASVVRVFVSSSVSDANDKLAAAHGSAGLEVRAARGSVQEQVARKIRPAGSSVPSK